MSATTGASGTADDPWSLQTLRWAPATRPGARAPDNPVGGYYGLRKGNRGRFANYVTPILEALGLVELEHGPRNNRVKARG